jgi:hypothetical protein
MLGFFLLLMPLTFKDLQPRKRMAEKSDPEELKQRL